MNHRKTVIEIEHKWPTQTGDCAMAVKVDDTRIDIEDQDGNSVTFDRATGRDVLKKALQMLDNIEKYEAENV